MKKYAIDELHNLSNRLPDEFSDRDPVLIYMCALLSELAYYYIPPYEMDKKKRAKLIPSNAYKRIVRIGIHTNVQQIIQQLDLPNSFVIVDRGTIIVGIEVGNLIFIAFRGSQFLFDWKINVQAKLVKVNVGTEYHPINRILLSGGKRHSGFYEESMRVARAIEQELGKRNIDDLKHIVFTGHSLGGAVAAITETKFRNHGTSLCVFGTPRFTDVLGYEMCYPKFYTHVRRKKDKVPTLPSRTRGYADHPYEQSTNGERYYNNSNKNVEINSKKSWIEFCLSKAKEHEIEIYRREVGRSIKAEHADCDLCSYEKLVRGNV